MNDEMVPGRPHRLARLRVTGLWGSRDFDIKFHRQVNVIVGPNGSGKTTLINLIRYVLTGDIVGLSRLEFDSIRIDLKPFGGGRGRILAVDPVEDGFRFSSGSDVEINISVPEYTGHAYLSPRQRHEQEGQTSLLKEFLLGTVPAVWLPVTRRLPSVNPDDDIRRQGRRPRRLESVDHRLDELLTELGRYRIQLDAAVAREYKRFEKEVLALILFREEYASPTDIQSPTDEEKAQLINAFRDAGLFDSRISKRIDAHFEAARRVAEKMKAAQDLQWEDVMVFPLIPRTQEMIRLATELEIRRQHIFDPLKRFTEIVNGFFNGKVIEILPDGELKVTRANEAGRRFTAAQLSSGEKQLLILLIEALLNESAPTVYVADEPELSLHVEWQEMLLGSLLELAGEVQLVVATHSPDIVGRFQDRVITLGG